jgi:hypothetical protein
MSSWRGPREPCTAIAVLYNYIFESGIPLGNLATQIIQFAKPPISQDLQRQIAIALWDPEARKVVRSHRYAPSLLRMAHDVYALSHYMTAGRDGLLARLNESGWRGRDNQVENRVWEQRVSRAEGHAYRAMEALQNNIMRTENGQSILKLNWDGHDWVYVLLLLGTVNIWYLKLFHAYTERWIDIARKDITNEANEAARELSAPRIVLPW